MDPENEFDSEFTAKWASRTFEDIRSYSQIDTSVRIQEMVMRRFRRATVERLRHHLEPQFPVDRIVDVGCGIGEWIREYLGFSQKVIGIDVSAHFLEEATRRLRTEIADERVELKRGNALDFDVFDGAELVCFGACLMYFTDDELRQLLEQIAAAQPRDAWIYVRASIADPHGARFQTGGGVYRLKHSYDRLFASFGYEQVFCEHSVTILAADIAAHVLPLKADSLGRRLEPFVRTLRWKTRDTTAFCNWLLRRR